MSVLRKHIQRQQDKACTLCGLIEAIAVLDSEGLGVGSAQTALIKVVKDLADDLNTALDTVSLPDDDLPASPSITERPDTPVARAYQDWRDFAAWVNSPATRGMDETSFEGLTDQLSKYVDRVIATPPQSHLDVVIKFLTVIEDYQLFNGIIPLEAFAAEARKLVGA